MAKRDNHPKPRPLPDSITRLLDNPLLPNLYAAPPMPGLLPGASSADYFAALMGAYWLLHALRRAAARRSVWRGATFETIRRTFVKVAVRVQELLIDGKGAAIKRLGLTQSIGGPE